MRRPDRPFPSSRQSAWRSAGRPGERACIGLAAAMVTALAASQACAQPAGEDHASDGWSLGVGGGAIVTPEFRGASTYRVRAVPAVTVRGGDNFTWSGLQGEYTVVRSGSWTAGAQGRFRFGQKEKDSPTALRGLGDVGASVELGAFVGHVWGPVTVTAGLTQDVAGGHGGQVVSLDAVYSTALAKTKAGPIRLNAGPSLQWVSAKFNRTYYGVDAAQSLASGLAPYRPGSGLESAGMSATLIAPLNRRVTFAVFTGYDRLLGPAADSPRVRQLGSRDQVTAGAFVTYRLL